MCILLNCIKYVTKFDETIGMMKYITRRFMHSSGVQKKQQRKLVLKCNQHSDENESDSQDNLSEDNSSANLSSCFDEENEIIQLNLMSIEVDNNKSSDNTSLDSPSFKFNDCEMSDNDDDYEMKQDVSIYSANNSVEENFFTDSDQSIHFSDSYDNLNIRQKNTIEWMIKRERQEPYGGIIASNMGTIDCTIKIIISLLLRSKIPHTYNIQSDGETDLDESISEGHTLILCSSSNFNQCMEYIKKIIPLNVLDVYVYYGKNREESLNRLTQADIILTTITIVQASYRLKENSLLYQIKWGRIVLCDVLLSRYNYKYKTSKALCQLSGICHWVFTSSMFVDKVNDDIIFGLIKYINYEPLNNFKEWKNWLKNNPTASVKEKIKHISYYKRII